MHMQYTDVLLWLRDAVKEADNYEQLSLRSVFPSYIPSSPSIIARHLPYTVVKSFRTWIISWPELVMSRLSRLTESQRHCTGWLILAWEAGTPTDRGRCRLGQTLDLCAKRASDLSCTYQSAAAAAY